MQGLTVDAVQPLCFNQKMEIEAYIAIGSNIGNRELNLLRAVAEIGKLPKSRVTALSSFYETSPVGNVSQDMFYNAVLRLATALPPRTLLSHLLQIEDKIFKRVRNVLNGPRRMDLDLLLYGNITINDSDIIVPHPRMLERRFVLEPLSEIAPELLHPETGKSIREHIANLNSDENVVKL